MSSCVATVVAAALAAGSPALEAQRQAEMLADSAAVHYEAGEYGVARAEWVEAHALSPDPRYLWGQAQAARLGGDCQSAIALYAEFLDALPEVNDTTRQAVEVNVADCETKLPPEPSPTPAPPPPRPPPSPRVDGAADAAPVARSDDEAPQPAWYRSTAGGITLGVGTAALVGGGVLGVLAATQRRAARGSATEGVYGGHFDRANRLRAGSIGLAAAGGATLVVSAIIYSVVARRR